MAVYEQEIAAFMANLESITDFTIKIEGYERLVHSRVLANKSTFFTRACYGSFKESNEKTIELHDEHPWMVARMIQWFYLRKGLDFENFLIWENYEKDFKKITACGASLSRYEHDKASYNNLKQWELHAALYRMADKYETPLLMEASNRHLMLELRCVGVETQKVEQVVEYIGLSLVTENKDLFQAILETAHSNATSMRDLYETFDSVFESNESIMEIIRNLLIQKSTQDLYGIKPLLQATMSVNKLLTEAYMSTDPFDKTKETRAKIVSAKEILEDAQLEAIDLLYANNNNTGG